MIDVPVQGRPSKAPGSEALVGIDGNVFAVLGTTTKLLARAGASPGFLQAYQDEATSGDYDHALGTSMAYLDAGPVVSPVPLLHEANRQAAIAQGVDPDTICPQCGDDLPHGHPVDPRVSWPVDHEEGE